MDLLGTVMIFGISLTILLIVYAPIYQINQDQYGVRLRRRTGVVAPEIGKPKNSFILIALKTLGDRVITLFPQIASDRVRQLLIHSNHRNPAHLSILVGIKSVCAITLGVMILTGSMDTALKVLSLIGAAIVAWTMPNYFLAGEAKRRQERILHELPTVLDLLIVCAQAGSGLLMSLDKVQKETQGTCPNLSSELEQMINEVRVFGKSVGVALRDMGERCGVEDITSMASALISSEAKGADISYPLRQQATALRDKLKRKKEEEAAKIPVKMVPVIMVFIMPLILCPMLGPAIIIILGTFGPASTKF